MSDDVTREDEKAGQALCEHVVRNGIMTVDFIHAMRDHRLASAGATLISNDDALMCAHDPAYATANEIAFAVGQKQFEKRGVTAELRRVVRMALENDKITDASDAS